MTRIIKVGDQYLGLVDHQSNALRFSDDPTIVGAIALQINGARCVKLTTSADRTADSMRGLADDVMIDHTGRVVGDTTADDMNDPAKAGAIDDGDPK